MASPLPPGPRHGLLTTLRTYRRPHDFLRAVHAAFGDTVTIPTLLGPIVTTADPDGIKQLFSADPLSYDVVRPDVLAVAIGENSVLAFGGARHQAERKLLAPPFHGARMRTYGALLQTIARTRAAAWQPGTTLDLVDALGRISLDVILQAVCGATDDAERDRLEVILLRALRTMTPALAAVRLLRVDLGPLSGWGRFLRARRRLDALLGDIIARRRATPAPREDVLSLLLEARYEDGSEMSEPALRDELVTLLGAGHETTATAMAWALELLHRHPGALVRLRAELDGAGPDPAPDVVLNLPFLEAVCNEALRLYPLAPIVSRMLARDFELCGHTIPKGTIVGASVFGAHRRPATFPEPESFRPERFLERRYTPFEFLPFGGGARRCLGAALAQTEMKLVLATLLSMHRFETVGATTPEPSMRAAFAGPSRPLRLRVLPKTTTASGAAPPSAAA